MAEGKQMNNPERTRTIHWAKPAEGRRDASRTSGLEYLQSIVRGELPSPPVACLVGYRIKTVEEKKAVFELTPEEYHYNPFSTVHGGMLTTLMDSAITASVLTMLPKGKACATMEIKVNFIRPVSAKTGVISCEATLVHASSRIATSRAEIRDSKGKLYAQGLGTCAIFSPPIPSAK
jgi:uncharacterized protein (TIGR00369 family)